MNKHKHGSLPHETQSGTQTDNSQIITLRNKTDRGVGAEKDQFIKPWCTHRDVAQTENVTEVAEVWKLSRS